MAISFSIAITTYNRKSSFYDCLDSIYNQCVALNQYAPCEILIVDDCSVPSYISSSLIKDYPFIDMKIVSHSVNQGLAAARNSAIQRSRYDWFTFCDDDDIWLPNKLQKVFESLTHCYNNFPDILLCYDQKYQYSTESLLGKAASLFDLMCLGFTPPVASQFYRADLLRESLYSPQIKSGVDHDLWISLIKVCNPHVFFVWGAPSLIGQNCSTSRMTTNPLRNRHLNNSFNLWRPHLTSVFGFNFYSHFVNCYHNHLLIRQFTDDIKARHFFSTFLLCILKPKLLLLILRKFVVSYPSVASFAPFTPPF